MAKFDYLAAIEKAKSIKAQKANPVVIKKLPLAAPSRRVYDRRFLINLTPAMHDKLQEAARCEMRSMSGVIRVALQQYIDAL